MLSVFGKTILFTIKYSSGTDRDTKKARLCERAENSMIQNEVGTLGGRLRTGCLHSVPACPSLFKNTGNVLPSLSTYYVWEINYPCKKFYIFDEKNKYGEQSSKFFYLRRFGIFNLLKYIKIFNWKKNLGKTLRKP